MIDIIRTHLHLPYRQTLIHYCAANNFIEFLHDLTELGAAIDIADNRGETRCHSSVGCIKCYNCLDFMYTTITL